MIYTPAANDKLLLVVYRLVFLATTVTSNIDQLKSLIIMKVSTVGFCIVCLTTLSLMSTMVMGKPMLYSQDTAASMIENILNHGNCKYTIIILSVTIIINFIFNSILDQLSDYQKSQKVVEHQLWCCDFEYPCCTRSGK